MKENERKGSHNLIAQGQKTYMKMKNQCNMNTPTLCDKENNLTLPNRAKKRWVRSQDIRSYMEKTKDDLDERDPRW